MLHTPDGHRIVFGDSDASRVNSPGYADPYLWTPTLHTDDYGDVRMIRLTKKLFLIT